jgi:hypothetical protein
MKTPPLLIIPLITFLLSFGSLFGQSKSTIKNSFVIHGNNLSQSDLEFYTRSIEASDFEQFRLQTQSVFVVFKNGFNLELISAKDLVVKNIKADLDVNFYTNYPANPDYKYPLFEILPSGWIIGAAAEKTTK